jgi:hypothetical protein
VTGLGSLERPTVTKTILASATGRAALGTALAVLLASSALAQDATGPRDWSKWDEVQRFSGYATIRDDGALDYVEVNRNDHSKDRSSVSITFELEREAPKGYGRFTLWNAVRAHVEGERRMSASFETNTHRSSAVETAEYSQELKQFGDFHLTLDHETGKFEISTPANVDEPYEVHSQSSQWTSSTNRTDRTGGTSTSTSIPAVAFDGQADRAIGSLTAAVNIDVREADGGGGHTTVGHITLLPEWRDVEVVVTLEAHDAKSAVQAYEDWRPLGSIEEPGKPGDYVIAKALLKRTDDTDSSELPEALDFRFELLDTSREPGVAMNWPLGAIDPDADLRLSLSPGAGELGLEGQFAVVPKPAKDRDGHPSATARIDSLDFGGKTQLRVIAELADGRKVFGKLEDAGRVYDEILLPKRSSSDAWIADAWRKQHDVEDLFDDDDGESQPEGDGDDGDGLTLYEEYRGFAVRRMQGHRVEGDPKRKDFFILNLVGSDAWTGLRMFADATGLRVIHRLEKTEMSEESRLINENHRAAPHKVDQHGVVLKTLTFEEMGHHGAQAFGFDESYSFALKPKTTRYVAMPARDDPEADHNKPYNIPPAEVAIAYDLTVVHEMLHSIAVAHHGEGDDAAAFRYIPAAYKGNAAGRAVFWIVRGSTATSAEVLEETTKMPWIRWIQPAFDMSLDRITAVAAAGAGLPASTRFADLNVQQQWIVISQLPPFAWGIGVEHGQHSGDEQCPMRYQFAELYPAKRLGVGPQGFGARQAETYYLVPQNSEEYGSIICTAPTGTGVNALSHKPQSRYGDAAARRGNCLAQMCVNDATPNHPWGLRR